MSDEPPYDNDVARKIAVLTDNAVQAREDAEDHISNHDVILALMEMANRLGETKVQITYDYDSDTVDSGTCLGFVACRSGDPSVVYKIRHGKSTRSLPDCSDEVIADAVETVNSTAFQQAALSEAEDMTEAATAAARHL